MYGSCLQYFGINFNRKILFNRLFCFIYINKNLQPQQNATLVRNPNIKRIHVHRRGRRHQMVFVAQRGLLVFAQRQSVHTTQQNTSHQAHQVSAGGREAKAQHLLRRLVRHAQQEPRGATATLLSLRHLRSLRAILRRHMQLMRTLLPQLVHQSLLATEGRQQVHPVQSVQQRIHSRFDSAIKQKIFI